MYFLKYLFLPTHMFLTYDTLRDSWPADHGIIWDIFDDAWGHK